MNILNIIICAFCIILLSYIIYCENDHKNVLGFPFKMWIPTPTQKPR
jgi:hypothetical protein